MCESRRLICEKGHLLANTHIRASGYPPPRLELMRTSYPGRPEVGPAISRVLMDQVASGERMATARISRPGRVVAFGRRDTVSPGYPAAVAATARAGFLGMERLTGGRVAAHAEGTMVLTLTTPEAEPAHGTTERFRVGAELARSALEDIGIDARIGPVPGEYCPGDWSINGEGRIKLAGIGQRMIKGAVHVGFVIVASGSEAIRSALIPVHEALGLPWDPATAGAADDLLPGVTVDDVEAALLARLASGSELSPIELDAPTLELAVERSPRYRPPTAPDPGTHPVPG